ncbi:glycosyl transferase family 1 [Zoogloeaceae bacteirum Par-f-2]|jgi:glycosyltransferase involved in cell wall biosynthesis|uniref:glycosyltransferase family 4 protein n=1 Tax=Pseudothauera hydrothermalis TaxID=2184083 RepID=UPI000C7CBD50|nr:glycosyltransferase family 4 protein [Pseudothauera hydrothermalis]AUM00689.1 glycosyl transferase family 1 [Rhodocyclaceae bacterium]AVZ80767.1 glycosyl transferase family 1 [Zoogloeaceae bacteirum Par-f-2]
MKIALLCSGLGHVNRGHEVFARGLFELLREHLDITLFKGGGEPAERERVIDNLPRRATYLEHIHATGSPRWAEAIREQERCRIEAVTFAYAALKPLLEGGFDLIHCLEREVCEVIHQHRHLFRVVPRIVFSNGGAIPARELPPCDAVQEHSAWNLQRSARNKAFMIPHGVDLARFHPDVRSDLRERLGIPAEATLAISVGTICHWHKRMDYVIRELAPLESVHLLIVGQENADSAAIKALGQTLMGGRIHFATLPHDQLPSAYAAADVFVLGSLAETFGIVYIEALAMGLPVFCTQHPNQRAIVQEGVFIDMSQPGALTAALRDTPPARLAELRRLGPQIARRDYDLRVLRQRYIDEYQRIAATPGQLPAWTLRRRLGANLHNLARRAGLLR